ncbi:hypothetical protein HZS61_011498 [Fusarium oxysporum f. sp. conglutinans]|uniref:Glutathione S-transferase C-terminal domain-containing protein n=2 Tax=Fusarium oxysporum f. sp. conglutinans TaxID=100902 RepID=A0A8H6GW95_FUSOX|nr:hypothetical protein FOXB_07867 [Fusarium oxysporum f. sp. conglutinans Fo5176]KAF6525703.1 hypothetical protein HZS61_011498 [Fusarium oxysporum f. sp. conglutinans]KAG6996914.1 hypothetical protein FocnCong_v015077 [Fusarium oxysporum f. sp. conglutinans]
MARGTPMANSLPRARREIEQIPTGSTKVYRRQLPNILQYLGQQLNLAPKFDADKGGDGAYHVNQLTLTALDGLSNELHDTHHPMAVGLAYEDQKEEAKRAKDWRENRMLKFLAYFERVP